MTDFNFKELQEHLLSYPKVFLDFPFGKEPAVYKVTLANQTTKMFALLSERQKLLRLSLKCDPLLAQTLRKQYESVLPGYHLPKKHWNTLVLSGQLKWSEVTSLIEHSYQLVSQRSLDTRS